MTTPRTIVITGASDGIGAAAARQLAAGGDRLILVGRTERKLEAVAQETGAEPLIADFARLDDVRLLAIRIADLVGEGGIDVLANNAGGVFSGSGRTDDGHEMTFQVNHLAPFLLTSLLRPQLARGQGAVVATSSMMQRMARRLEADGPRPGGRTSSMRLYAQSKLANVLTTRALHARGIPAVAFHPGVVATSFGTDRPGPTRWLYGSALGRRVMISAEQGGANLAWFISGTPGTTWTSGRYYDQRRPAPTLNPLADDAELADRLWHRSAELVGVEA